MPAYAHCQLCRPPQRSDQLSRLQIGVVIPGFAEIPGHALRPDCLNPDVVTVQVDLQNAFNLCDRSAMTQAVSEHLHGLLPHVQM